MPYLIPSSTSFSRQLRENTRLEPATIMMTPANRIVAKRLGFLNDEKGLDESIFFGRNEENPQSGESDLGNAEVSELQFRATSATYAVRMLV